MAAGGFHSSNQMAGGGEVEERSSNPRGAGAGAGGGGGESRVPEIRKDSVQNRWVIFSPARSRRPSDLRSKFSTSTGNPPDPHSQNCPFCLGNEHLCAPEIFRVHPSHSAHWKLRVIQNLYPALSRDELPVQPEQVDDESSSKTSSSSSKIGNNKVAGFGFHDVVIEAPFHSLQLLDLSPAEIGDVLLAYKKRILQLRSYHSIQYVQVFKNHGASAGASLSHSHSQIIALPVVPTAASARIDCMKQHFEQTGKCNLCEVQVDDLLIDESAHFISIVPFAATFPFEIWIIPRDHSSHFHEVDNEKAVDLGGLLKLLLRKISSQLNDPPYNMMIHTTPFHINPSCLTYTHWFLQIVPQLTIVGGFEVGTGCHINPIFPEDAAKVLREVQL
ncbi:ADP-glucose phosphorylase-like [Coffea arabica]|uniref:ADP-glucose phosphorylase-like n=1 Tax=Coffea arabica TaxID=13443 RepID=A0ABM4US79_COFAR